MGRSHSVIFLSSETAKLGILRQSSAAWNLWKAAALAKFETNLKG